MKKDFAEKLESLIASRAEDFAASKLFKQERVEYYDSLAERFSPSHPRAFLVQHARAIEEFVEAFFRFVLRGAFGDYAPPTASLPIAFIALGSFGREQCAPYSDVDLMIVYKETAGYNLKPLIERVIYLAWDSGFHLGHRVHEVGELCEAARGDITIKTAMLEGRFFYGSRILWVEIQNMLERIRRENRDEFVAQKIAEYRSRKARKPIVMEPDLKEGAGGLRDANALFWIANAIYGVSSEKDMIGRIVAEEDYREFHQAAETLYRARVALHLLERKKLDILLMQRQREAALLLGFSDAKTRKAERFFLQKVLLALRTIDRHCDYYIERIASGQDARTIASEKPQTLRDLAQIATRAPIGSAFDISFVMALKKAEGIRLSGSLKQTIRAIFERPDCHILIAAFDRAGRLETLLPPLKNTIALAQFDGYHNRPVDEHSILTLKNLNLLEGEPRELFASLNADDQALLRLVALLHDCGKGGMRDHRESGALRFRDFAKALGLRQEPIDRGMALIRMHTLMSRIARAEDIYSDRVALAFASKLGDKTAAVMLYLLTICDMSAVAPGVYSPFAAGLLRDLYFRAIEALDKDDQIGEVATRLRKERQLRAEPAFLALSQRLQNRILTIDSALFFVKFKPAEIIDIARRADETTIASFTATLSPSLSIDAIAKKPFNLGWFLGKLARFDLGSMDIFRLFDGAKLFRMSFRKPFDEPLGLIATLIEDAMDMSRTMKYAKPQIKKREIEIDCDHSISYARMSLDAPDQQGLMAFVIDVFDRRSIDIAAAKITTIRRRANNLFLIEKSCGFCEQKDEVLAELTAEKSR